MASQKYARAFVRADGVPLFENTSVEITRNPNNTSVSTTAKGRAGVTPGAMIVTVRLSNAVPARGFEYDVGDKMLAADAVVLTITAGDKVIVVEGEWMQDSFKHSTNSNATYDADFEGAISEWTDL
jgi:predicted nucleotidyltransferase